MQNSNLLIKNIPSLTKCSSNMLERTLAEQKPFPKNMPVMIANLRFSSSLNPFIKYRIYKRIGWEFKFFCIEKLPWKPFTEFQ